MKENIKEKLPEKHAIPESIQLYSHSKSTNLKIEGGFFSIKESLHIIVRIQSKPVLLLLAMIVVASLSSLVSCQH